MSSASNNRRFPRRRTKDTVRVEADGLAFDCIMVDVSEGGLGLLLRSGDELPDRFAVIDRKGERRPLAMVWRSYPRCGAVFCD